MKNIKLRIVNRSATEAFSVGGKEITRSHDETLTLTMAEADALVAAFTGLKTISVSFVSDAPDEQVIGELTALNDAHTEIERLNGELATASNLLEEARALNDQNLAKIAELEGKLTQATSLKELETVSAVKADTEQAPTETAAPKKAATTKGTSK